MSKMKRVVKNVWRKACSLGFAVTCKTVALSRGRKPSRSCQIPGLDRIVGECNGISDQPVFVEVGAYDGERFSNTSWLADNGWRGVYVEPSPEFSQLCRLRHCLNNVKVLNVAAGESTAEATLMQAGSLSTMSTDTFEEYSRIPWASQRIQRDCERQTTQIRTLNSILSESGCRPGFELLVVDVEGYEENVFKGFDLAAWQPRMVIVELCDAHPDFAENPVLVESARRVREVILSSGYREVYRDEINTVFELRQSVSVSSDKAMRRAA